MGFEQPAEWGLGPGIRCEDTARERSMNQRLISVLFFAFIVSAGASLLLYRLLSSRVPAQAAPKSSKLMLAARDLTPGTLIRDADLRAGDC